MFPNKNVVFIDLRAEESRGHIPFTLLEDLPLDSGNSSTNETSVSESLGGVRIAGLAHVVSWLIAQSTDWLS